MKLRQAQKIFCYISNNRKTQTENTAFWTIIKYANRYLNTKKWQQFVNRVKRRYSELKRT